MIDRAKTDSLMKELALLLAGMKQDLEAGGYVFDSPKDALLPPSKTTAALVQEMRLEFGAFPYSIESFYKFVGAVDFTGSTTAFEEFEFPDPIQLGPFDYYGRCLNEFLSSDVDREYWMEGWGGFALLMSADYYHKEDISGGPEYHVVLPAANDDPQFEGAPELMSFLNYLALALRFGGFPGYVAVGGVLPPYYSNPNVLEEARALSRRFSELALAYRNTD